MNITKTHRLLLLCGLGLNLLTLPDAVAAPKRLNNFVVELLNVKIQTTLEKEYEFANPREGWVFFQSALNEADSAQVTLAIDSAGKDEAILIQREQKTAEAMRWLAAGKHKSHVWIDGKPRGRLIIRAIPEILLDRFTGDGKSPDGSPYRLSERAKHGADRIYLYYWDFLEKYYLKNVNVVINGGADSPGLKDWYARKRDGKKVILGGHMPSRSGEGLYEKWSPCFKAPYDGVLVDEFVPPVGEISNEDKEQGGYRPGWGFEPGIMEVIKKIHENPELKGKFYAYLGFPGNSTASDCGLLMETILPRGYLWVGEFYMWPQSTETEANAYLDKMLKQRMLDFRSTYPGCEKQCIVCLAMYEHWDNVVNIDQRVWLDMQFEMMANDPAFEGVYGVDSYLSTYTDPEMMLWTSRLFRHYCIEGRTDPVSAQYGYHLMLNHLENADFTRGKTGWSFAPAAEKSIRIRESSDLPFKQGYLPKGPKVLTMERKVEKPNGVSQEIKNLKAGQLYTFKMFSCDLQDLKTRQKYAQSIQLSGVEVLNARSRQDIQQGDGCANEACWNYTYRVFRATEGKATLQISDWADEKNPGGPIGQKIVYNFMKIQPLYEAERQE